MVLASTFEEQMAELLRSHEQELQQIGVPVNAATMGIGMTFAHASHPFADARDLAFKAMKQAKDHVGGACSAVSWVDLTVEDNAPPGRHIRLDTLLTERRNENPIAALAPSARATLGEILNSFDAQAKAEVDRWSDRTGNRVDFNDLEDNLSRARWWPKTPMPEELQPEDARA